MRRLSGKGPACVAMGRPGTYRTARTHGTPIEIPADGGAQPSSRWFIAPPSHHAGPAASALSLPTDLLSPVPGLDRRLRGKCHWTPERTSFMVVDQSPRTVSSVPSDTRGVPVRLCPSTHERPKYRLGVKTCVSTTLRERRHCSMLERAIEIAVRTRTGQVDKAGEPYILHPLRAMSRGIADPIARFAKRVDEPAKVCESAFVPGDPGVAGSE